MTLCRRQVLAASFGLPLLWTFTVLAGYEAPDPAYAPPASYYNSAVGTGPTLKSQLYTITSTGFISRSYGDARYSMTVTDRDPANANNILLAYNRASINGDWDGGATWNREHIFPKSWLNLTSAQVSNTYKGVASDLFELRPSNPTVNSTKNNWGFGTVNVTPPASYGVVSKDGEQYFYPGDADRGDMARALFYMATRYGQNQTNNLTLANGTPALYRMGDLASLLKWHYEDGVDNFERYRNQAIYSSTLNPSYYQNNRNPFVDHPEYVWTIFGTSPNDSKLYLGNIPPGGGNSTATVDLGRVIVGGTIGTGSFTLNKSGVTPTTYDVTVGGAATSNNAGVGQPMPYNTQARSIQVGLSSSTATAGLKTGTVTVDNTDVSVTGVGAGLGSNDGNDVVTVNATVLAHSKASFSSAGPASTLTLDFGTIAQGTGSHTLPIGLSNLVTTAGYTAALDLDQVTAGGNTAILSSNFAPFSALPAGATSSFLATLNSASLGTFSTTYNLTASDENLSGATGGQALTLTLKADVLERQWYTDADGTWSASSNWLGPVPQSPSDSANFLDAISAPRTVTLSVPQSSAHLRFDSPNSYTLAGSTTLTLSGSPAADVNVDQGNHTIAVAMNVAANTSVDVAPASALALSGAFGINDGVTVTKSGGGSLTISGQQTHGAGTLFVANAGTTNFESDPGAELGLNVNGLVNFVASASAAFHTAALDIGAGGLARVTPSASAAVPAVLYPAALNLADSTARLDLTNNELIAPATLAAVKANLIDGSLFSSSVGGTLGYLDLADGRIEVRFTLAGDTNLDGIVDVIDLGNLAGSYGITEGATWVSGDFDLNGAVDVTDLGNQASNYGRSLADNLAGGTMNANGLAINAASPVTVPEPTGGLILIAIVSLAMQRRPRIERMLTADI